MEQSVAQLFGAAAEGGSAGGCTSALWIESEMSCESCQAVPVPVGAGGIARVAPPQPPSASVEGYAGAQKVFESDGAVSLALSVVDGRLRINAGVTHYYEEVHRQAAVGTQAPARK